MLAPQKTLRKLLTELPIATSYHQELSDTSFPISRLGTNCLD